MVISLLHTRAEPGLLWPLRKERSDVAPTVMMANARNHWKFYPSYITSVTLLLWYGIVAAKAEPFEKFAYRGSKVTLNCTLTDSVPVWLGKNGKITKSNSSTINPKFPGVSLDNKGNLIIHNAQLNDTGLYSCTVLADVQEFQLTVGVRPEPPEITRNEPAESRIRINENEMVNLTCVSRGGYPAPALFWFNGDINVTSKVVKTNLSDGTITVTAVSSVSGKRENDRANYTCVSSWVSSVESTYIILYLNLRPTTPIIKRPLPVPEHNSTTLVCISSACRPAGNMSWSFDEHIVDTANAKIIYDRSTDTFNMSSYYTTRVLIRDDNKKQISCRVGHGTLETLLVTNTSLDVQFPADEVELTGNSSTIANGDNKLTLECKTTSANPVANITWSGLSVLDVIRDSNRSGQHNGFIREQSVTITPLRSMDGKNISCAAEHFLQTPSQKPKQTIKLDLQYSPVVNIMEGDSIIFDEGNTNRSLNCSASSKPASRFSWYGKNGAVSYSKIYTISSVHRTHFGVYVCRANNSIPPVGQDNITVRVRFPPETVMLSGNNQVVADGSSMLELNCSTDSAFPKAVIYWQHQLANITSGTSQSQKEGKYGGFVTHGQLKFLPERRMDGDVISCLASNSQTQNKPVTNHTSLNLSFHTIFSVDREVNATEGQSGIILSCSADSKPPSSFKWIKAGNETVVFSGDGKPGNNMLNHTINNVSRFDAGNYRCEADNQIGQPVFTNNILKLNVHYPPDVSVLLSNATVNDSEVGLMCVASGLPSIYSYSSWRQSWPGDNATLKIFPPNATLTLTNLSYEDTGVYHCSASNGVKHWTTHRSFMTGSGFLLVKTFPIVVNPITQNGQMHKVPARLNRNFSTTIQLYSNYDSVEKLDIVMRDSNNRSVNGCVIEKNQSDILLQVHRKLVSTRGISVTVTYTLIDESEFGYFYVDIKNDFGAAVVPLKIQPEGPPCPPTDLVVEAVKERTVILSWKSCFHGGFAQTFVIEYSKDESLWINGTSMFGGLSRSPALFNATIDSLQPNTRYYIRLYSYNIRGSSNYTLSLDFTTDPQESQSVPFPVVAVACGGVGAAIVVIIIAIMVVMLKRRLNSKAKDDDGKKTFLTPNRNHVGEDHDHDDTAKINLNPMYESSDTIQLPTTNADVYAKVDKQASPPDLGISSNVYSVVNKAKQKESKSRKDQKRKKNNSYKKSQGSRQADGSVYENAEANGSKLKCADNIYENPVCSSSDEKPCRVKNDDGLIYIEVDLPQQKGAQNKQPVIHGEERTIYADVSYGKVGEPIPESDEDEK